MLHRLSALHIYIGGAIGLFLFFVLSTGWNMVDIPFADDFDAIQDFLLHFIDAPSIQEKWSLLISPHNEHRILLTRLVVIAQYYLTGKLNYVLYPVMTLLFMSGMLATLVWSMQQQTLKPVGLFLVGALLFNGQNFESVVWPMAGVANVGTLFLVMLTLFLIIQPYRSAQWAAVFLSFLAIYSNGNGTLVYPVLLLLLFVRKKWPLFGFYFLVGGLLFVLYFVNSRAGETPIFETLCDRPWQLISNFLVFVGNNFWIPGQSWAAFTVGAVCAGSYLWVLCSGRWKSHLFLFSALTFMFLTAVALVLSRDDAEAMAPLRYRIYGSLFLALTVVLWIENIPELFRPVLRNTLALLVLLFALGCDYLYYDRMVKQTEWKMVTTENWRRDGLNLAGADYVPHFGVDALRRAEERGIYSMPRFALSKFSSQLVAKTHPLLPVDGFEYGLDYMEREDTFVKIKGWAFLKDLPMNFSRIYVGLVSSEGKQYWASTFAERRFEVSTDLSKRDCGFYVVISTNDLPSGSYQLALKIEQGILFTPTACLLNNLPPINVTYP